MNATVTAEKKDFTVAKMSITLDSLTPIPGGARLVARVGASLYALEEATFKTASRDGAELRLDQPGAFRLIAEGIENTSLDLPGDALACAQGPGISVIRVGGEAPVRRIALPDEKMRLANATLSADGRWLLLVVRDDADVDFARYDVVCWETPGGSALIARTAATGDHARKTTFPESLLSLSAAPQIAWCAGASAFLVLDPLGEKLYLVRPGARQAEPVETPDGAVRSIESFCAAPDGSGVTVQLRDLGDDRTCLRFGTFIGNVIRWDGFAKTPDGLMRLPRWRPNAREIAYVRSLRRKTMIEVIDAVSSITASFELPRGWYAGDLAWSADGRRLYIAGQIGIGVWELSNEA